MMTGAKLIRVPLQLGGTALPPLATCENRAV